MWTDQEPSPICQAMGQGSLPVPGPVGSDPAAGLGGLGELVHRPSDSLGPIYEGVSLTPHAKAQGGWSVTPHRITVQLTTS